MVIEIRSDIFTEIGNLKDVNYLIGLFSNHSRYGYFCDISIIAETELYNSLLDIDRLIIEDYFNKHISESTKMDFRIESNSNSNAFNLEEAKRYFIQPFTIILENSLNDSYFLNAIILNFKNRSKIIKRHLENGWLDYGNGGGLDNIINQVSAKMKQFENLPKENHKYLRCFVLVDSDKKFPNDSTKKNRENLFQFLNRLGIPYHELEKREMENYLPDEVIETIENNNDFVQAYLRLNDLQKDYFDLEKGFIENLNSSSDEVKALYANVSVEDYKALRSNKIQLPPSFKSEFPKLFSHSKITKEALKKRVSHQTNDPNELETILDKISKLL
ncbi:MAG: hypothetical protein Q8R57_13370 [Bacteroidota bacterium]|nr:hypothetical protein [Bacteroidota bacterium]